MKPNAAAGGRDVDPARRQFLKGSLALGSAAAALGAVNPVRALAGDGSGTQLTFSRAAALPGYFGTTKLVGDIQRISEVDIGFLKAARGFYGPETKAQSARFVPKYPLSKAIGDMRFPIAGETIVDGASRAERLPIPDPEEMSKHIKAVARFLRTDAVGIGELPSFAIYTHSSPPIPKVLYEGASCEPENLRPVNLTHKYAIGILVDQNLDTYRASTGFDGISASQSMMSYLYSGVAASCLASYIRQLGWPARAHHSANYQIIVPPVLVAAGLGEMGRCGESCIHPELGFRFSAAVVTTDLPLVPDGPIDFGLQDFCSKCKKCVRSCPSGAIGDGDPVPHNGYMRWPQDSETCTKFFVGNREGASCRVCMKVCPWGSMEQTWFHQAGVWSASRSEMARTMLIQAHDLFGYGTPVVEKMRWWLEWPELY